MALPRVFATVGLGLAIAGAIGTLAVRLVAPAPFIGGFGFNGVAMAGYVIAGLTWASIGALLVIRRPDNVIGWIMVVVGVGYSLSQSTVALTFAFVAEGTAEGRRLGQIAGWVTVLLQLVAILHFAIAFLFPTGRTQGRGWARFMRVFWVFAILFVVTSLSQPGPLQLIPALQNPFAIGPDLRGDRPIAPILAVMTFFIFPSLVVSMVTRFRSAGHVERQQLKWFVLASGLSAIALGIVTWEGVIMGSPEPAVGLTVYVFAGALVPVAIGIAILRHHLYEIDRIISRTIGWAVVSGLLIAAFAGMMFALQAFMSEMAEGQTLAVAASTLVAYALFQSLRRPVQRAVDRRFDRAGYSGEQTAAVFSNRLQHQVHLAGIERAIAATIDETLRPTSTALWIRAVRRHARHGADR